MAELKLTVKEKAFIASMEAARGAVGKFSAELNGKLSRSLKEGEYQARNFSAGFGKYGEKMTSVGQALTLGVTLPLGLLAKASSDAYAEFDALRRALGTVEPTAMGLSSRLKELREIAKAPGIGFQEAIQGDVRLRAVGVSAKDSAKILREFANAIAMTGGGAAQFNEVTVQLGQMSAKGKVLAQDLRPIIEAAPAVATALKRMFGTVSSEMIAEQLEKAGKSSTDMIRDLVAELEKAPRVTGGWKNTLENLNQTLFMARAEMFEVADNVFGLQSAFEGIGNTVEGFVAGFKALSPETQRVILGLVTLAAVAGPVIYGLGAIASNMTLFIGSLSMAKGGIGLMIAALGYLAIKYTELYYRQQEFNKAIEPLSATMDKATSSSSSTVAQMNRYIKTLETAKVGTDRWKQAKDGLIAIDPKFKELLSGDIINFTKLKTATAGISENIVKIAQAKALQAKAESIMNQLATYKKGSDKWDTVNMAADFMFWTYGKESAEKYLKTIKDGASNQVRALGKSLAETNIEMQKLGVTAKTPIEPTVIPYSGGAKKEDDKSADKEQKKREKEAQERLESLAREKQLYLDMMAESEDLFDAVKQMDETRKEIDEILKRGGLDNNQLESLFGIKPIEFEGTGFMDGYIGTVDKDVESYQQRIDELKKFEAEINDIASDMLVDFGSNVVSGLMSGEGLGGAFRSLFMGLGNFLTEYGKKALFANESIKLFNKTFNIAPGTAAGTAKALGLIAGGALLRGIGTGLPKLAQGGMATNPVLAMIGDNASGKEMVLPFERTGEFANMIASQMGGGGGNLSHEIRIKGQDLLILIDRANKAK